MPPGDLLGVSHPLDQIGLTSPKVGPVLRLLEFAIGFLHAVATT
jgi:hypothetical protein